MYEGRVVLNILAVSLVLLVLFFLTNKVLMRWVLPTQQTLRVLLSLVTATGVVFILLNLYVYHGFGYQGDIYRRGDPSRPWVALTFDDGPSAEWTPAILDILAEYEVPAAFFVVGSHVDKYPDIAARIVEEGHEIGNHTYNHVNIPSTPTAELSTQILRTTFSILTETGEYPKFLRPPRGLYDTRIRRLAELLGQPIILWTISGQDWLPGVTSRQMARRVVSRVKPGDILLFHDSGSLLASEGASRRGTVAALPEIIEGVRAKGLEFVPLERLLQEAEPVDAQEEEIIEDLTE